MKSERAPRRPIWWCAVVERFDDAGQRNELLVDGRARFEVLSAEEDRGAGIGMPNGRRARGHRDTMKGPARTTCRPLPRVAG
jgi:hypothetical protein